MKEPSYLIAIAFVEQAGNLAMPLGGKSLKENLNPVEYDNVRFALGLDSLTSATQKGQQVTGNIRKNIEEKTNPRS